MAAPYGYNLVSLDRTGWTATTNDATFGPAANALDGNTGTIWATNGGFPAWLAVDMKAAKTFDSVAVLPRQDGFADFPGSIELYVSTDGSTWGSAIYTQSGLPNNAAQKIFTLTGAVTWRWVKYQVLTQAAGARIYQGAAEFNVGNKVPVYVIAPKNTAPLKLKTHQRVRAPSFPLAGSNNSGFTG